MYDTSWLNSLNSNSVGFILIASILGFVSKGLYELWSARRKEQLERVNQQLRLFYGPLYTLNQASNEAWIAFRKKTRPNVPFFGSTPPPTPQELEAWRYWMRTVFAPINDEMLTIITKNSDMLIEADLPIPLQSFCAHVAAYKVVLERWNNQDFSEHASLLDYPTKEIAGYLETSFKHLKSEQARLLGAQQSHSQQ